MHAIYPIYISDSWCEVYMTRNSKIQLTIWTDKSYFSGTVQIGRLRSSENSSELTATWPFSFQEFCEVIEWAFLRRASPTTTFTTTRLHTQQGVTQCSRVYTHRSREHVDTCKIMLSNITHICHNTYVHISLSTAPSSLWKQCAFKHMQLIKHSINMLYIQNADCRSNHKNGDLCKPVRLCNWSRHNAMCHQIHI